LTEKEYALSPLVFNFGLNYTIRKVHENQVGLKLNGTYQFLAYADDTTLMGDNIYTGCGKLASFFQIALKKQ
jgi:hypothetical protein